MYSVNVVFNYVNKIILVSSYNSEKCGITKTGEPLHEFKIPGWYSYQLTSQPNGPVALVDKDKVMMLQMYICNTICNTYTKSTLEPLA